MAFPTYSVAGDTVNGTVLESQLDAEVRAAGPYDSDFNGVFLTGDVITMLFAGAISGGQETTVDGVVAAHAAPTVLDKAKTNKATLIDQRTVQLIDTGFESPGASGDFYEVTGDSGKYLLMLDLFKASIAFPVVINTIDNLGKISLADIAALDTFVSGALGFVRGHEDSGTVIKDSIRAAADLAAVAAIVDPR